MTAIATLITNLRILGNDTPTSNLIWQETLKPKPDGTRTKFFLDNKPVVASSVYITTGSTDGTFRIASGFTMDLPNGIVTFTVAPASNLPIFTADYNFYWFSDADHTEFLNEASKQCSASDAESVVSGLQPAMMQFALYYFWMRRASQWAHRYASTGGMAGQSVDEVTKSFLALAKQAWEAGEKERDKYYENQGANTKASTAVINYGIDPYTPIR